MESKYNPKVQAEINDLLDAINTWKNLFSINTEFYSDGWAIMLREDKMYPRRIVVFRSVEQNSYSLKSFEVRFDDFNKEKFKELFSSECETQKDLLKELKAVIYGKDLINNISETYYKHF